MFKIIFFLLFPSIAFADQWTSADTYREITYQTFAAIDWIQTRHIAQNSDYWEQNVILGNHPSVAKVNQYFAVTGVAHYLISKALPEKYRTPFQYITVGIEIGAVSHNFSIGLRIGY